MIYYGCSQPRELWFHDFNYVYIACSFKMKECGFQNDIPVTCMCIFWVLYKQGYIHVCHSENHRVFECIRVLLQY